MGQKSASEILLRYAVFISLSSYVKLVFYTLSNDNMLLARGLTWQKIIC